MATETTVASINGYAFASVIHEASKSRNDSEGLLYGEITTRNVCTISDSQSSGNRQECDIAIQDVVAMTGCFSFYNHVGGLIEEHVQDMKKLGNMKLVGWYKIRRNSSTRPSLREQVVTKRLLSLEPSQSQLMFLLITPSSLANQSTMNYPYKCFLCQRHRAPSGIQMKVINLGHTGSHPEYRMRSLLLPSEGSGGLGLENIYENAIHNFCDKHGQMYQVKSMFDLYSAAIQKLQRNQDELAESEETIRSLKDDIEALKGRLKASPGTSVVDNKTLPDVNKDQNRVPNNLLEDEMDNPCQRESSAYEDGHASFTNNRLIGSD